MTTQTNHALLIGVGADLPNTIQDATGLATVLTDPTRCAYTSANVAILTERDATRTNILVALDELAKATASESDSTVIVYFSGHGAQVQTTIGESYFLMPFGYDLNSLRSTAISGQEFADKLAAIPSQRLLLLLDCCHAGGLLSEQAKVPGLTVKNAAIPPEAAKLFAQGDGKIVIASSKDNQFSFTGTKTNPYSLFTRAIIECLCGQDLQDAGKEGDGFVRALDLAMYASRKVARWSKERQHPTADTQKADNFIVAYYAAGAKSPLPLDLPPINEVEMEEQYQATTQIANHIENVGAGAQVSAGQNVIQGNQQGNVVIGHGSQVNIGGDLVGGNKTSQ